MHIDKSALVQLGAASDDDEDLLRTLNRHMPRLHALALHLAAPGLQSEVTVGAAELGGVAARRSPPEPPHAQGP